MKKLEEEEFSRSLPFLFLLLLLPSSQFFDQFIDGILAIKDVNVNSFFFDEDIITI